MYTKLRPSGESLTTCVVLLSVKLASPGQPWSRQNQSSGLDEYCWQPCCQDNHKKFEETKVEPIKIKSHKSSLCIWCGFSFLFSRWALCSQNKNIKVPEDLLMGAKKQFLLWKVSSSGTDRDTEADEQSARVLWTRRKKTRSAAKSVPPEYN
jgi:hypothetical protein